jgi:Kef-type K+ transport system membrane component KefB
MAYLTGRVHAGEPTLAEAVGMVLLCVGTAIWLGLSPILAAMAMGSTVCSLARHHNRPFHAIEGVEWPFLILFFVLAGASLHLAQLAAIGWIGALYIVARVIGLYAGSRIGGRIAAVDAELRRWLGVCLLPQAGVALGMALLAAQRFPGPGETVLSVILATTIVFEITAPPITRKVLQRVGAAAG